MANDVYYIGFQNEIKYVAVMKCVAVMQDERSYEAHQFFNKLGNVRSVIYNFSK
jgi:hypothetical protein